MLRSPWYTAHTTNSTDDTNVTEINTIFGGLTGLRFRDPFILTAVWVGVPATDFHINSVNLNHTICHPLNLNTPFPPPSQSCL